MTDIEIKSNKIKETEMSNEEKMALRAAIERSVAHLARTYGVLQDEVWMTMYEHSFEEV